MDRAKERQGVLTSLGPQISEIKKMRQPFVRRRLFIAAIFVIAYRYFLLWVWSKSNGKPALGIPLLVTWSYFCVVVFGVRFMDKRDPVSERIFEWNCIYNISQGYIALYLFNGWINEAIKQQFSIWGNSIEMTSDTLKFLLWLQFQTHLMELWDTLFLILRKRYKAFSILHCFLRLLNLWGWYGACHYFNGGDVYFMGAVNALVNFGVYAYFLTTLVEIPLPPSTRSFLIRMHMFQFLLLASNALYMLWVRNVHFLVAIVMLIIMMTSYALHIDFFHTKSPNKMTNQEPKLVFSFDSSSWMVMYHWGVAAWLQDHFGVRDTDDPIPICFSGSSGGALVALALAARMKTRELADVIIGLSSDPHLRLRPWQILTHLKVAIDRFFGEKEFAFVKDNLRVLLTKVQQKPPFLMAEVVSEFTSRQHAASVLLATSHIPIVFGIKPSYVPEQKGWFYDGLFWPSMLVPWRLWKEESDCCIKVSALSAPTAHISPQVWFPLLWYFFPPSQKIIRGIFWAGYKDADAFFRSPPRRGGGLGFGCRGRHKRNCPSWSMLHAIPTKPDYQIDPHAKEYVEAYERAAENWWSAVFLISASCILMSVAYLFSKEYAD